MSTPGAPVPHLAYQAGVLRHDDLITDARRRRAVTLAHPRPHRRLDRAAVADALPIVASVVPFGLVVGVSIALAAGGGAVPAGAGLLSTPLLFGGSAQLAALDLLAGGAGALAVIATVAIVNARLLLYGAALAPSFADQPGWFRWAAPILLVDQTYAAATGRQLGGGRDFRRYWLTVGGLLAVGWLSAVGTGAALGPVLSELGPLRLAAPACFVGLLVPRLTDRRVAVAAAVAALVAAAGAAAPRGLGLLAGAVAGLAVAVVVERRAS